jgi:hypothetical protein
MLPLCELENITFSQKQVPFVLWGNCHKALILAAKDWKLSTAI